jgi:MerR family redox-sensitive transcriptional activator SoxR
MAIGEVARRAGINASAIRYYEKVGLLAKPERVTGRRRYEPGVLELLAVVRVARQAGFTTISETRTLMHGFSAETPPSERWRQLAADKLLQLEAQIERTFAMKRLLERGLRCHCLRLEDCALVHDEDTTSAREQVALK